MQLELLEPCGILTLKILIVNFLNEFVEVLERITGKLSLLLLSSFLAAIKSFTIFSFFHLLEHSRDDIFFLFFGPECSKGGHIPSSLYLLLNIGIIIKLLLHHLLFNSINFCDEPVFFSHCCFYHFVVLSQFFGQLENYLSLLFTDLFDESG